MNKNEFLESLRYNLAQLSKDETEKTILYYDEMIDDMTEDGMTEEEAVESLGSAREISENILKDLPMSTLIVTNAKSKNTTLFIVLAIAGFPIWIAAASIIFAFYVTLWSLIAALYASTAAFYIGAIGCVAGGVLNCIFNSVPIGICAIGGAFVSLGLALLMTIACAAVTKGIIKTTSLTWRSIKSIFITKGGKN